MKNSLAACLMLCISASFAQLSVQNDAYVFVSDQVLFVTDDVNIDDVDSKIYLREEAQLLQGTGVTGNSGLGELSVYQEGNVNQWSYNYWCSPVGNNSAAFGNEDARVELLNDATGLTTAIPAIFIPGYNGSSTPLTISNRWLFTYQTSDQYADWVYVGSDLGIKPGLGFTMKGTGGNPIINQRYDFRGKPNNGTIDNIVNDEQFTLVGNPYPSALDAQLFINDPQNQAAITGTLLFWEHDTNIESHVLAEYIGGYAEYTIDNLGNETFTPARFATYDGEGNVVVVPPGPPGGLKVAKQFIPIGQGFMVEGRIGSTGTVRVKNQHRTFEKEGTNSSFFRNVQSPTYQENGYNMVADDYKRFRLNIDFNVDNSEFTRQVVLNFHDSATSGFDYGMELKRSAKFSTDAYFSLEDKAYSAQAFPFEEALKIPLVVDIEAQQPLRFRIFDIQNFEASQGIYIHDIENDTFVNLRTKDYELNIEPGNYTDRFEIVFTSDAALDLDTFDFNSLIINQNNGLHQLYVLNPKSLDITSIEVYDVAGKRLLNGNYDAILNRYELSTVSLSAGVYIVNVNSKTNAVMSQKIIVKN